MQQANEGIRVLIVEDHESDRSMIRRYLETDPLHRFQIEEVSTPEEGVRLFADHLPEVVMVDFQLPGMSGVELLRTLNSLRPNSAAFLLLTGTGGEAVATEAFKCGAQDYLVKAELTPERLHHAVTNALHHVRLRRSATQATRKLKVLTEASHALARSSRNGEATAEIVARAAVDALGGHAAVRVISESGELLETLAVAAEREAPGRHGSWALPPRQMIEAPEAAAMTPAGVLRFEALSPEAAVMWLEKEAPGASTPISLLVVGAGVVERWLGVLMLWRPASQPFGPDDEALAIQLAERAAIAFDNVRLFREMQEAIRTRDELLAATSHDLKTPLAVIRMSAQILARQAQSGLTPERALPRLEQILRNTQAMNAQIEELLDIARLQSGLRLPLERRPVDLADLAREKVQEVQALTTRHRLVLEADAGPMLGEWDAGRIERVINNLLSNAVKYAPDGGEILVRVRKEVDGKEWIVLEVSDSGIGIPAADLAKIFGRFQRGRNTRDAAGAGIGLSSVKKVVEEHGGMVTVSSVEGKGSTFRVQLPGYNSTS